MKIDMLASALVTSAKMVDSTERFSAWIRSEVRPAFPHAGVLVTLGRLYGIGSVPTHRISVDFPLSMVEALKTSSGALDNPLMAGWLRSGKSKFMTVIDDRKNGQERWRRTLSAYGFRNVLLHGVMDHRARRFAALELYNCSEDFSRIGRFVIQEVLEAAATAAWGTIDNRIETDTRNSIGHPTNLLTPTELHIVQLLAQGLSNKEIARLRGVSDSTVKTQVQRTGSKLGATRRAEIVALAMPFLCPLPPQTLIDYGDDRL